MSQAHFRLAVNLTSAGRRPPGSSLRGAQARAPAASDTGHPGANHQSPVAGHHLLCSPNTQHPPTTSIDKPHRRKPARPVTKKRPPISSASLPRCLVCVVVAFCSVPFLLLCACRSHQRRRPSPPPRRSLAFVDFEPLAARRRSREIRVLQETQSAGRFPGPISDSNQALPPALSRVQEHVPLGLMPAPRWVFSTSASTLFVAGNNRIHRRTRASVASIPTAKNRA